MAKRALHHLVADERLVHRSAAQHRHRPSDRQQIQLHAQHQRFLDPIGRRVRRQPGRRRHQPQRYPKHRLRHLADQSSTHPDTTGFDEEISLNSDRLSPLEGALESLQMIKKGEIPYWDLTFCLLNFF